MKVKIQYTVDIEAVPNEVANLGERINELITSSASSSAQLDPEGNIGDYLSLVTQLRKSLYDADMLLSDCEAIMQGYANAVYSNAEEASGEFPLEVESIDEQ